MPRKHPRDKFGTSQGHPGCLGRFIMWKFQFKGRMSAGQTGHTTGQMGHFHGTDGTHSRGCPAKILCAYCFFFFPHSSLRGQGMGDFVVSKYSATLASVAAPAPGARQVLEVQTTRDTPRRWQCYTPPPSKSQGKCCT